MPKDVGVKDILWDLLYVTEERKAKVRRSDQEKGLNNNGSKILLQVESTGG